MAPCLMSEVSVDFLDLYWKNMSLCNIAYSIPHLAQFVFHDFVSWFQTLAALLERMGQVFWLNLNLPDGNADAM